MAGVKASDVALRLAAVDKSYGPLAAVRGASLDIRSGAVTAVVGENGAGKSTLLKIAAGIVAPDRGEVWAFGQKPLAYGARRAQELGVAMVHQHFALFGGLTALDNVILGAEPTGRFGRIDRAEAARRANEVMRELGVSLPLDAKVESLGVGDRQRLEIVRALYRRAKVLILDEPTAVLTPGESGALYATLRRLTTPDGGGRAVVVVTHKLDEVLAHADLVTVMRRGRTLGTRPVTPDETIERLSQELVGGEALPELSPAEGAVGDVTLSVTGLAVGRQLRGVDLQVRGGEVVGVAGVLGNGQSELVLALGGLLEPDHGTIEARSIAVVHEDRQTAGLVLDATVSDNLLLGGLRRFTRRAFVDDEAVAREADARIARFDIRPPDRNRIVRTLSGGNQQKIVLARALAGDPAALVVAHPTRGVDLVAARAIHEQIRAAAARGVAVLVVSADLAELRLLSRRIVVMVRGRIVRELPPSAGDAVLGAAMLGGEAA